MKFESETDLLPETDFLEDLETLPIECGDLTPVLIVLTGNSEGRTVSLKSEVSIGRSKSSELSLDDRGVSRRHAVLVFHPERGVLSVSDLGSKNGTFIGEEQVLNGFVKPDEVIKIGPHVAVQFTLQNALQAKLHEKLYQNATSDGLTGLLNKNSFLNGFTVLYQEARRRESQIALIIVDGDKFKLVNDTWGHSAGDQVLKELAVRLKKHVRKGDLLARFGGEEFVLIVNDCAQREALALAERVRIEVATKPFVIGPKESIPFSVSIGVATLMPGVSQEQFFELADQALYAAKEQGRNRVVSCHTL